MVLNPERPPDSEEESDEEDRKADHDEKCSHVAFGVPPNFNFVLTARSLAAHLFNQAGVVVPFRSPLQILMRPEGRPCIALTLCDNHHYDYKPTEAQARKLQDLLGFPEPPMWMLSTRNPDWSARKVHTR